MSDSKDGSGEFKEGRSIEDVCSALSVSQLVEFAKVCEVAERYEDMVAAVSAMAQKLSEPMTAEQRNLFSVAFKNVVGAKRASWRVLENVGNDGENAKLVAAYMSDLEAELHTVCNKLLSLISAQTSGDHAGSADGKIFFHKMAGDYYRYMAELEARKPEPNKTFGNQAQSAYDDAYKLACAKDGLPPTNPIRLGLVLNFSVFHYEILQDKESACELAKQAFDAAIAELDSLGEEEYKDSTLIMQLIRDNLSLWQSNEDAAPAPEDDGTMVQDL